MIIKLKNVVLMLLIAVSFTLIACEDIYEDGYESGYGDEYEGDFHEEDHRMDTDSPWENQQTVFDSTRSSISMTLDEDDNLSIERMSREESFPMGEEGTWTIFVYLCGTDLESEDGMASMDMQEMERAATGDKVRFIVQTGGAGSWENGVDASCIERYEICDQKTTLLYQGDAAGMGEAATLADFLAFGISGYSAEHMGLILWNHGGGSITGVCFDETDDYDSLSLRELDAALLSIYDSMTDNFEFIGFDACLMGTVECANILASYADYMYGSEESEPGYGWDYKAIGDYLGQNSSADGAELGKVVADSFYSSCAEIEEESAATLSVIDLSQIDALLVAFNTYAANLYEISQEDSTLSQVVRNAIHADNFGGNNKSEGYTNMVDLKGIVTAGDTCADGAEAVLEAIEAAVVYARNGSDHSDACGLAIYYPLMIQGSAELKTFGQIAVSPYYLSFVDRAAYGAVNAGNMEEYDNSETLDLWGAFTYILSDDETFYDDSEAYYDEYLGGDYWSYYDDYEQTGESPLITFREEPALDEDGVYGFVLSEEALYQTASVQANVYELSEDEEDLIELGISVDIYMDWDIGAFYDNFDGCWFSLPDGQNLAVYMVSENDGYDIYTSPILLNGEETNLRITHDYVNGRICIDGAWDGIDESGMADKEFVQLEAGDEITPLYYAIAVNSDDEYTYYGESYTFDGDPEICYDYLPDGEFFYGFYIDDIYGDYYVTDYVQFSVEGIDVYYYE